MKKLLRIDPPRRTKHSRRAGRLAPKRFLVWSLPTQYRRAILVAARRQISRLYRRRGRPNPKGMLVRSLYKERGLITTLVNTDLMTLKLWDRWTRIDDALAAKLGKEFLPAFD
ncbi:MAG: hypothetical protein WC250_01300 [Candidatus Paceibacterota bacterium]